MVMLGVDIGTTNWKVVAYTLEGRTVASWKCRACTHHLADGWVEYHPTEIWDAVCNGIREVIRQLDASGLSANAIGSVAVTSVGESGVLINAVGEPLGPIIAWFDPRTIEVAGFWTDEVGASAVYNITGFPPNHIASINKMLWLKQTNPSLCSEAKKWLCVADYVAFKLCGEAVMDLSLASRTMALNIGERSWADELLQRAEIPMSWLPELAPSGTGIGKVSQTASLATGLSRNTVVATGGHDHICGALAVGVVQPGDCLDSLGTAEAVLLTVDKPVLSSELLQSGYALGCHTAPGRFYLMGAMQAAGGSIEWLCDTLGEHLAESCSSRGELYAALMAEAAVAPPGSDGLLFMPHLMGLVCPNDPTARGSWLGLTPRHRRAHLLRSVIEGLAHEAYLNLGRMERLAGICGGEVTVIGGGTRNSLWMQTRADVMQRVQRVPATDEATTLGAAILGALGAGYYRNVEEALAQVQLNMSLVHPQHGNAEIYQKAHIAYTAAHAGLVSMQRMLASL